MAKTVHDFFLKRAMVEIILQPEFLLRYGGLLEERIEMVASCKLSALVRIRDANYLQTAGCLLSRGFGL